MRAYQKILLGVLVAVVAATMIFSIPKPQSAQALGPSLPNFVEIATWVWTRAKYAYHKVESALTSQLLVRTVETYVNNLAYNMATSIATNGAGGKPLFETKSVKNALKQAQEAAAGEFIGQLSASSFSQLGFNLCEPSLNVRLSITLGLIDSTAPPTPKCNWQDVKSKWERFGNLTISDMVKFQLDTAPSKYTSLTPLEGSSSRINVWQNYDDFFKSFSLEQSDWGVFGKLNEAYEKAQQDAVAAKDTYLKICNGYLNNETTVSEDVKTTCKAIVDSQGAALATLAVSDIEKIKLPSQVSSPNPNLSQVMKNAGKYFISTLASKSQPIFLKLVNKWLKEGMASFVSLFKSNQSLRDDLLAQLRGGADLYQPRGVDFYSEFKKIEFDTVESYGLLDDFAVCPEDTQYRKPDNCVISADFLQAVNSKVTVQEAIDSGYINGGLPLVGRDDALRDSNSQCYRDGLCYSNLVKLRKANIIPVGWEMAALKSPSTKPATLQQAIDCFEDDASKCSVPATGHNPYYHLIDPNWILKAPAAICSAYVYAPVLEAPDSSNRQQYCADTKVCLREDDKGNCLDGQYGYCTKSENIWRFQGDICQDGDIYSGCLTFSGASRPIQSYLEQSLSYCTADQVGCQRYSQEKNDDGEWVFQSIGADDNDLFLNKQAQTCSAAENGCSEFIIMAADSGANLFANGDFEMDSDSDLLPDGYAVFDVASVPLFAPYLVSGQGVDNSNAALSRIGAGNACRRIDVFPNTLYNFSASFKQSSIVSQAEILLQSCTSANSQPGNISSPDGSFTVFNDGGSTFPPNKGYVRLESTEYNNTGYTRVAGTINSGDSVSCWVCAGGVNEYQYVDNLKVEIVSQPKAEANYSAYGAGAKIVLNGSRSMCTAQEVGCQGYTPSNGDPMIPAVINQTDLCPSQCVGYASFAQQTDIFDAVDPLSSNEVEYYNFIPKDKNTKTCPAQAVGCEEFTNLDEVAKGGEGKEYYTYLRQCVAEDLGHTYYTWEGSDVAGYQIKTWLALSSNSGGPCTNVAPAGDVCLDDSSPSTAAAICTATEAATDPNCRQFFDSDGTSYYRYQNRIIFASGDCHDYRRTATGSTFRAIPSLSTQCEAQYKDCRSYYGNTANNVYQILSDNFEQNVYSPWQAYLATIDLSPESLENNGHSLKIVKSGNWADIYRPLGIAPENNKQYQVSWWMKNDAPLNYVRVRLVPSYNGGGYVRFRVKDSSVITDGFLVNILNDSTLSNVSAATWHRFEASNTLDFNDIVLDAGRTLADINWNNTLLVIDASNSTSNDQLFFDNIIFKEVNSSISVIKNSWQTPIACDTPYTGYYLGCQTYTDTNNNQYNLHSFSSLCRVEAIGCMPAIDTHNSSNPFAETFNAGDNSEITVPADNTTYLVPDNTKYCASQYKGCMALGVPDLTQPSYLTTVYKINNPDYYGTTLCPSTALGCDEYISSKGTYYFRDPGTETCTYKKNISVDGSIVSGWFKTSTINTNSPIACNDYNNDGSINLSDSVLYMQGERQGAQVCSIDKNLCTAFVDPSDPQSCTFGYCANLSGTPESGYASQYACESNPSMRWVPGTCQTYYYYNNDNIDKDSCAGEVDKNSGCALFYEANDWNADHSAVNVTYDSTKTYDSNVSTGKPVSPVICNSSQDPTCELDANILLKVKKDRQCGEWLACRSSSVVWDSDNNKYKVVCADLSLCNEFDPDNNITKCGNWVDPGNLPLTEDLYQSRTTGANNHLQWGDMDYTGFSIPDFMPVAALTVVNFGTAASPNPRLVYAVSSPTCLPNGRSCDVVLDGTTYTGVCQDRQCTINPDLSNNNLLVDTRGFTSADAPFPISIAPDQNQLDRLAAYAGANMCQSINSSGVSTPNGCELSYVKLTYGSSGEVRYYPKNSPTPNGICTSGDLDSKIDCVDSSGAVRNNLCDTYNDDGTSRADGMCSKKTKAETVYNWPGICLEKDYNAKLVNDTGGNFYCNQWYPAEQINGMNSLYDNYREAGYYNPTGQDALFCSVAEPFQLQTERIYCGRRGGSDPNHCNLLLRVPAGSKVLVSNMAGNNNLINYGYLRSSAFNFVEGNMTTGPYYMFDRIEKVGIDVGVSYEEAKFSVDDFVIAPGTDKANVPVVDRAVLAKFFDTGTNKIELYFYDEDINRNGDGNPDARILVRDITAPASPFDCQGVMSDSEPNDVSSVCNCGVDIPGLTDRGCHEVWRGLYNPLPYNYYVKAETPPLEIVTETDCSDAASGYASPPGKGIACLNSRSTTFANYWTQITNGTIASEDDCRGNANCEFAWCLSGQVTDNDSATAGYQLYCSEFGGMSISGRVFNSIFLSSSSGITSCMDRLFSVGALTQYGYSVNVITSVDQGLLRALFNDSSATFEMTDIYDSDDGCIESNTSAATSTTPNVYFVDRPCGIASSIQSCITFGQYYTAEMSGSPCTGLACYQQCRLVAQLDPEGDKSWVRTDIWWRNENNSRNNYPGNNTWLSYYYKSSFLQNSNVNYKTITGETVSFTHFGAALGYVGKDVVNVRAPFNATAFSPLSTATFFYHWPGGPANLSLTQAWGTASGQLDYLFVRSFNLQWNNTSQTYEIFGSPVDIYEGSDFTNKYNIKAGPDYNPAILQVCGNNTCDNASGVTVDDRGSGEVKAKESLMVALKFYYYAHPDHMPVSNITVNWGDGSSTVSAPGKYKNNIPDCNQDIPMPGKAADTLQGFGGTDRACREGYKTFYHDYQLSSPVHNATCSATAAVGSVCFQPTVTVTDHWGNSTTANFGGQVVIEP
ncbi:MAG: hypothetical protein WC465_02660 [Patescibacteria group bacterium]